jgi:hypothetical protein
MIHIAVAQYGSQSTTPSIVQYQASKSAINHVKCQDMAQLATERAVKLIGCYRMHCDFPSGQLRSEPIKVLYDISRDPSVESICRLATADIGLGYRIPDIVPDTAYITFIRSVNTSSSAMSNHLQIDLSIDALLLLKY